MALDQNPGQPGPDDSGPVRPGIVRGALAGIVATAAMSLLMLAARRAGLMGSLPPTKISGRLLSSVRVRRTPGRRTVTAVALHFGFGAGAGALFGLLRKGPLGRPPRVLCGLVFGTGVWLISYMGWVPALGIMEPAHRDRPGRPQSMLAAHWVYGAVLGGLSGR